MMRKALSVLGLSASFATFAFAATAEAGLTVIDDQSMAVKLGTLLMIVGASIGATLYWARILVRLARIEEQLGKLACLKDSDDQSCHVKRGGR
jgi:hypothetical protein